MRELVLNVEGIECMGCENRIKNAVSGLKYVKEVSASHETGKVNVILNCDLTENIKNEVIGSIENLDFKVEK